QISLIIAEFINLIKISLQINHHSKIFPFGSPEVNRHRETANGFLCVFGLVATGILCICSQNPSPPDSQKHPTSCAGRSLHIRCSGLFLKGFQFLKGVCLFQWILCTTYCSARSNFG